MIEDHLEWRQNLQGKTQEVKLAVKKALSKLSSAGDGRTRDQFVAAITNLQGEIDGFKLCFSKAKVPEPLKSLREASEAWVGNPSDPEMIMNITALYERLDTITVSKGPSFTVLINHYKKDEGLQSLLDELIAGLKQILDEGGEIISASVAQQLQGILEEIERRERKSIIDLAPWVESALISLATIADSATGSPLCSVAVNVGMTAYKARKQLYEFIDDARKRLLDNPVLKRLPTPEQIGLPGPMCDEEEMRAFLERKRDRPLLKNAKSAQDEQTTEDQDSVA